MERNGELSAATHLRDPADVPSWLAGAIDRLARTDDRSIEGLLRATGESVVLEGTRANCRCHFVTKDQNGRPRVDALAEKLANRAIDYCIPRSRIAEAQAHLEKTQSAEQFSRLAAEARQLFTTLEKSGEGGELLLYLLIELLLGIPQILCKMPLKTSEQMHVHGADGIHGKLLPDGTLALYWGESKVFASVDAAIDACFESLAPFLADEGSGAARRDLLLVRDNLDLGDDAITSALRAYFERDTPKAARIEARGACMIGFSLDDYPDPFDEGGGALQAEVAAAIQRWYERIKSRVLHEKVATFEIEVFCVPVPSADAFRAAVRRRLGLSNE